MMRKRRRGAVLVGRRHIHKDLSFGAHRLLCRLEGGVVAAKDFAVGQRHLELERFSLGIAEVGEIAVDLVFGSNGESAITFRARILRGRLRRVRRANHEAHEKKANRARRAIHVVHARGLGKTHEEINPRLRAC
jgi:hypothetical protein